MGSGFLSSADRIIEDELSRSTSLLNTADNHTSTGIPSDMWREHARWTTPVIDEPAYESETFDSTYFQMQLSSISRHEFGRVRNDPSIRALLAHCAPLIDSMDTGDHCTVATEIHSDVPSVKHPIGHPPLADDAIAQSLCDSAAPASTEHPFDSYSDCQVPPTDNMIARSGWPVAIAPTGLELPSATVSSHEMPNLTMNQHALAVALIK